jgi:hypothetical protein
MKIHEIFKVNMVLDPYSQKSIEQHIQTYKATNWKIFYKDDRYTLIESSPDILGRIYYIPFISSENNTISQFENIVGEFMEPSGYVEFLRNRILTATDSKKIYTCSTNVYTPHIRLSDKLRGTGLAMMLYKHYINNGYSLVTNNHTNAAASLWNKLGYVLFKLPSRNQTKLQPCEINDSSTVFKCILGNGVTISTL